MQIVFKVKTVVYIIGANDCIQSVSLSVYVDFKIVEHVLNRS